MPASRKVAEGRRAGKPSGARVAFTSIIEEVNDVSLAEPSNVYLAPGFVDLQVNGFAGVDFNDPALEPAAFSRAIQCLFRTGVTKFLPTVISSSPERMTGVLRALAAAKEAFRRCGMPEANAIAGIHVEGPHISPEDGPRGAHSVRHIRPPDIREFQRWQEAAGGEVRMVTVAPEYAEAPRYISALARSGVVVSIGHTGANSEQIKAAVDAGATISTHLGNGAHAVLPKTKNYLWDQLAEDRLAASFIADGIHIPQPFLTSAIRAKGTSRSVLVTDAVLPAMCEPGQYLYGDMPVELLPGNRIVLRGTSKLAGSALTMDAAVANCVRLAGVSIQAALRMATVNPARAAGIAGRQRGLAAGEIADLVRFRWDEASHSLAVLETRVAGVAVYCGQSGRIAFSERRSS
jgi:N-acetylglucosamine-6-phosphate deacetylase